MMKLRPKMMDDQSGGWGGWGTWVPVGIVLVAVGLNLFEVIPALWAAVPVALALLYTMAEPVAVRIRREKQFPRWARAGATVAGIGALLGTVGAALLWAVPGPVVAEGDIDAAQREIALESSAPEGRHDFRIEVAIDAIPPGEEPEENLTFHYNLRLGDAELGGKLGREKVVRRLQGERMEERTTAFHLVRATVPPGSRVRFTGLAPDLPSPLHVRIRAAHLPRLTLALLALPLVLLAAAAEAFERRGRKRERSRITMFTLGLASAAFYFTYYVAPDNALMGVLGAAIAGLAGALAGWVVAAAVALPLRPLARPGREAATPAAEAEPEPAEEGEEPEGKAEPKSARRESGRPGGGARRKRR